MGFKAILTKIWNFTKKIGKGIWNGIKWVCYRLRRWYDRTKAKVSRIYMIYACFMSGVIGFGKSIKAQYKVWKAERLDYIIPKPAKIDVIKTDNAFD